MKEELKVSLVQTTLHWEDAAANRQHFSEEIRKISGETDLIILPEMFTTGFSMNAETLAEDTNGETLHWMQGIAASQNAAITGSIIVSEDAKYYNRLYFVFPDGSYGYYNKKHTFTLAKEHHTYTAGESKLIVDYKGWKICPLICYDLRFPVWARNSEEYDLQLYVANWPNKRVSAWDALLKARAIENMSYCIGVNRIGVDGNGHKYSGHSAAYDVLGNIISNPAFDTAFVETVTLKKEHITTLRGKLQFLQDRDLFDLR